MRDDEYIDRLKMPKSAVEALARAVPDDVVKAIVGDNYGRWAPTPPKPAEPKEEPSQFKRDPALAPGTVRPLTRELDYWAEGPEEPTHVWDYEPFSNARIRGY
jgi:hypothetical protein